MAGKSQTSPEFSRIVNIEGLEPGAEIRRSIEANENERAALAERLGLIRLDSLSAEVALRCRAGGTGVTASGKFGADVVQSCVVSLEPVPDHIEDSFEEVFAPEGYEPTEDEEEDPPETFDGDEIDLGELTAQLLALALNPYPRAAGAKSRDSDDGDSSAPGGRRPFEGLAEMLKKRG